MKKIVISVIGVMVIMTCIGVQVFANYEWRYQIREGDTISQIIERELGVPWMSMIDRVKGLNPGIKNINMIYPGRTIILPEGKIREGRRLEAEKQRRIEEARRKREEEERRKREEEARGRSKKKNRSRETEKTQRE